MVRFSMPPRVRRAMTPSEVVGFMGTSREQAEGIQREEADPTPPERRSSQHVRLPCRVLDAPWAHDAVSAAEVRGSKIDLRYTLTGT